MVAEMCSSQREEERRRRTARGREIEDKEENLCYRMKKQDKFPILDHRTDPKNTFNACNA